MSVCERRVYPPDVVKYVKDQLRQVVKSNDSEETISNAGLPESMQLTETMKEAKSLRDALALTLSVLAANFAEYLEDIPIFGVIKETGVDDSGLSEFHREYFHYPLYRDQGFAFYKALGDRKAVISFMLNPLLIFHLAFDAWQRLTRKKIGGNLKGEGIVQGGIIIFDKQGQPIAMYQEETGVDLPVTDLVNALQYVRQTQEVQTSEHS